MADGDDCGAISWMSGRGTGLLWEILLHCRSAHYRSLWLDTESNLVHRGGEPVTNPWATARPWSLLFIHSVNIYILMHKTILVYSLFYRNENKLMRSPYSPLCLWYHSPLRVWMPKLISLKFGVCIYIYISWDVTPPPLRTSLSPSHQPAHLFICPQTPLLGKSSLKTLLHNEYTRNNRIIVVRAVFSAIRVTKRK
jgi:hypothetical protein